MKKPLQNDQGDKGVGESLCSFGRLLPWVRNTLTPPMDFLVQDQGHLLARDLADQRAGLLGSGSVGQRKSCSSCPHHFDLRPSAPKQAELGNPMTPQVERDACGGSWDGIRRVMQQPGGSPR